MLHKFTENNDGSTASWFSMLSIRCLKSIESNTFNDSSDGQNLPQSNSETISTNEVDAEDIFGM